MMVSKRKIIITGATGALGQKLVESFSNENSVICLVKDYSQDEIVKNLKQKSDVYTLSELLNTDITYSENDLIIHAATLYGRNGESMQDLVEANILFGVQLIDYCNKNGILKFVNIASSLDKKVSPYALSKSQFVEWLEMAYKGVMCNIVLEQFYSENCGNNNFLNMVIDKCLNNQDISLTDCMQVRDIIHVNDVLVALKLIADKKFDCKQLYNFQVGTGEEVPLRKIVEYIKRETNSKSQLNFGVIPKRENEPLRSVADITEIKRLGFAPQYDYTIGLKDIINKIVKARG